jgi:putative NADPH-quinone reductase
MKPEKHCPRYDRCSVNNCPLTVEYPNHLVVEPDLKTCPMEKNVRKRISGQFPGILKHGGLTVREHAALMRYELLSLEDREKMAQAVRDRLKKFRDSQKVKAR